MNRSEGKGPAVGAASGSTTRWLTPGLFGIGLTSLFADMSYEMVTAVFPIFLAGLGGGAMMLGTIEGLADAASSFMKLAMGYRSDRIGRRKPMILLGYLMTAVKGFLAFATSSFQVFLLRLFAWMGKGVRGPVRDALLADLVPPPYYGRAFGFHRAMDTTGAILGPLIAMSLVGFLAVRDIFLISFIPALLAVAAVLFLVPERPQNKALPAVPFSTRLSSFSPSFRLFLTSAGLFGLGNFAHTLLILRANELLTRDHGPARAASLAVFLYTLHNVFYAVLSYPVGRLSDRIGKRALLGLGYFLFALMSIGFIFVPPVKSYIGWLPALLFLVLLFALAGIYIALVDAMEGAYAADLLQESLRGTGYGMFGLVKGIGNFVSSFAVGFLWSAFSPAAGFLYAALMALLGGILLFRIPAR